MTDYFDVFDSIEKPKSCASPTSGCTHENTCVDSNVVICVLCGFEIENVQTFEREWRNYQSERTNPTRCIARKVDGLVIMKDLESMGLGEHIISIANDLYIQTTKGKIKRGKSSRKAIIAACLFHAYKRVGTPKSCDMMREIMKDTKLDKSDFLHGIKQVALNLDKSENVHTTYITPVDIIREMMTLLNASKDKCDCAIDLFKKVEMHTKLFRESRPQSVAAGVVFHYIEQTDPGSLPIKQFAKKVKISELTVNKIRAEITRIESSF